MKTLVIGLGGSGCRVAAAVKRMIGESNRDIQFVGFDTDTNQRNAQGLDIVQISRDAKVGEILLSEEGWQEWFPNNEVLMNENMLGGAGQKRVLSRLAFSDTIRNQENMSVLDRAVSKLTSEDGDAEPTSLKVMVVSSFAGGTGSGMFLQIPFYLRKRYLGREFGVIDIRGLFALPDVFVGNVNYDDVQKESLYSNAYAALKELAGINMICLSTNEDKRKYNIKIGDLFDSETIFERLDTRGDKRVFTAVGMRPYDFIFFVDQVNKNRKKLGGIEDYYDLMARITYSQVYSPIKDDNSSQEDNLIQQVIQSDGEAFYGSAGVSRMVYPYEDIVKYCALRMTNDTVAAQWGGIDKEYEVQLASEKQERIMDSTVKITPRKKFFVETMKRYMENGNENYAPLRSQVFQITYADEEKLVEDEALNRAEEFVSKMRKYIKKNITENERVAMKRSECEQLKGSPERRRERLDSAVNSVRSCENSAIAYKKVVDDTVKQVFRGIANDICPMIVTAGQQTNAEYMVRSLFEYTGKDERPLGCHPLAVRYMLYQVEDALEKEISGAKSTLKTATETVEGVLNHDYFDPSVEGRGFRKGKEENKSVEKASKVLEEKLVRNYKDKLEEFYDNYEDFISGMESYAEVSLRKLVLEIVLRRVVALNQYFERIFGALDKAVAVNAKELKTLKAKYNGEHSGVLYVNATEEAMENIYRSLYIADREEEESDIYTRINELVFERSMAVMKNEENRFALRDDKNARKLSEKKEEEAAANYVKALFTKDVVEFYQDTLKDKCAEDLDISVFEAMENDVRAKAKSDDEFEISEEKIEAERARMLTQLKTIAAPYLMHSNYHEKNANLSADTGMSTALDSVYWGVNTKVAEEIRETLGLDHEQQFFGVAGNNRAAVSTDDAFGRHEFYCYRGLYSVRLSEIQHFSEDPYQAGTFYHHYRNRVNKLEEGNYGRKEYACTPHLDIRWHNRQYLPMIGHAKDVRDDQNAARAMWLGLFFRNFYPPVYDPMTKEKYLEADYIREWEGQPMEIVFTENDELICDGEKVRANQFFEIFRALQQNTLVTGKLLQVMEPMLKEYTKPKGENNIFEGKRMSVMAKALIGSPRTEEAVEVDADGLEVLPDTDSFTYLNCLEIMMRISKHYKADEAEKKLIMGELWKIIEEYGKMMSNDRKTELQRKIFMNSPFVRMQNRSGNEVAWSPYFAAFVNETEK